MLQAGQLLHERYQLQQKLGHAANRQTWLATDLATQPDQLVIVKLLAFVGEVQWQDLKLFEREAQILKQLNHPQIPKYRDYFCLDEHSLLFGLVQEYIPGSSLKELLQQGKKFTEQQVRQIALDILHILIYLHELNPPVLHRDIKPSNILLCDPSIEAKHLLQNQSDNTNASHINASPLLYLVDFGTVQDRAATEGASFTVVGTYGYTPMEQFGGKAVPASDLYALAATLIHLLTGTAPADLPQRNLQIQFADASISPHLGGWLQQMIEPSVEKRFSTARLALSSLASEMMLLQPSTVINNSGQGGLFELSVPVPEEIKGWNWGAFLLSPLWLVSNRVWIGLLALVPIVGFWMAIALGAKGNEWAWKSRRWESIEQFKTHQHKWAIAGVISGISVNLIFWHLSILLLLSMLT
jgi:serine/threonine protein kinase